MSPATVQTRAGYLIGVVTTVILSIAGWEFGSWLMAAPPAPKSEVPTIPSRSTDRETVAQFPARIDDKPALCYVQILHATRKFNLFCVEVPHAKL